jgi:RNA polymerase sigma-54 factor
MSSKQEQRHSQLHKLSPQHIQLMKLIQTPTHALEQRLQEELEGNPALEFADSEAEYDDNDSSPDDSSIEESLDINEGDDENMDEPDYESLDNDMDSTMDEYLSDFMEDDPSVYGANQKDPNDDGGKTYPVAVENSLAEYLESQLGMLSFEDPKDVEIAKQIVGSIDDDGYLRRDAKAITNDLAFRQNIETTQENVTRIIKKIQRLDPPGIAASDLRECLIIQIDIKLESKAEISMEESASLKIAKKLLTDYFEEFTKKHYTKLVKQLGIVEEELRDAINVILKLNPKPSSAYSGSGNTNQFIVPDFIIENHNGILELNLNSRNAPDLRISDHYLEMMRSFKGSNEKGNRSDRKQKEAMVFIKQKLDSAKWFIDAIRQRQQTMYKTMYAIMQFQMDFFTSGDQRKLRPMILKDVSDVTGLDISTVSRVANSKYVQTEFGTKRLKDFFSESLQNSDGDEVSTLEVKKILSDIIVEENKKKPLSDEKLKSMLFKKGYNIARRTVAKYREQLNIPVARLRRAF